MASVLISPSPPSASSSSSETLRLDESAFSAYDAAADGRVERCVARALSWSDERICCSSVGSVTHKAERLAFASGRGRGRQEERTIRFEQLDERPDGDVLERRVLRLEEPDEVAVHAAIRLVPHGAEGRVIVGCKERQSSQLSSKARGRNENSRFEDRFPRAAALFPWTSTLGEAVNGMRTSQIPMSKSWLFMSSRSEGASLSASDTRKVKPSAERELTTQSKDGSTRCHLTLNGNRDMQDEVLNPLSRSGLDDRALVPLAARGQVAEGTDGVALDLLVLVVCEKVYEGGEEAGFDDGGLVVGVDRDVSDAGGGGQDEGEEGRAEKTEKRGEAAALDDFELVLVWG